MSKRVRLKTMLSAGEPIVRNDGTMEIVPMQIFRSWSMTVLRIGRSVYFFNPDGSYDGSEHIAEGMSTVDVMALTVALEKAPDNRKKSPERPYFPGGSRYGKAETADWPTPPEDSDPPVEHMYLLPPMLKGPKN